MLGKDPGKGFSPEDFIRSFMAGGNLSQLVRKLGVETGETIESLQKPSVPKVAKRMQPSEQWLSDFSIVHQAHINSYARYRPAWVRGGANAKISEVYENGFVAGTVVASKETYNVFVSKDPKSKLFGCNCKASRGVNACDHSYDFLSEVTRLLKEKTSPLATRINNRKFDSGKLDMSRFEYDSSLQSLLLLSGLSNLQPMEYQTEELAAIATQQEELRVAWNIQTLSRQYDIDLVLQQQLKRGGFGKGKKARLSAIFQDHVVLSEADKQVKKLIDVTTDRRGTTYSLDLGAATMQLIGEPNVTLDGKPVSIEVAEFVLRLIEEQGKYRFVTENALGTQTMVLTSDTHMMQVESENNRFAVRRSNSRERTVIRQLLETEPVGISHEKKLAEQAIKIQQLISLKLPESMGGKLVPDKFTPVLILRSRKDGDIDYGVRLRDSRGKLIRPCEGLLIQPDYRDKVRIQLVRDIRSEQRAVLDLKRRLGISGSEIDGTVQGFEQGLNLVDRLQSVGTDVELLWDKASEKPMKFIGTVTANNVRVGIAQKRDWFNLTGECKVGDQTLDIAALLQGLRDAGEGDVRGEFVKIGDAGWAKISESLRAGLRKLDDSVNQDRGTLRFDRTSAVALRDLQHHFQVDSSKAWNECLLRLDKAEKLEPKLPKGLQANLRDYQQDGFKWLRRLAEWGVGGVLADDMGLGKTVQTLAVILDRASVGPTLVIAPTSVGFNWMREVAQFAPQLNAMLYRETDRAEYLESVGPNQIVVCSYGLALRDSEKLAKVQWATMVLDEAQAIKNSRSKTSIAIATIPSKWTVALTGTPVENHLGELWSLFHVVSPGVLGGWDQFRNRFATPIEKQNDEDRKLALRDRLKPFILRRTKKEVLKDLPPRTEMNLYVELSAAERAMYDQVRLSAIGEIDAIAKLPDVQDQRFKILALLTRLRQISCHPGMVHDTWTEGSAKLTQLLETLTQLKEEGHRVLIFSQFVKHLTLIRAMLEEESISYQYLDGSTPADQRQKQVDQFQNGNATAFLISLKAGGTGLNLTAADYVIHMDPWWNPAVEDQATDRAHRIGQDKPVMVYRIVAQNTIEEEILRLHDTKRDLVAGILDGSHSAGKLSTEDLIALIRN